MVKKEQQSRPENQQNLADNVGSQIGNSDNSLDNLKSQEQTSESQKDLQDENLRLLAELENERKIRIKENEQVVKFANQKFLLKIIPLIENYGMALKFSEESENSTIKSFVIGFEMIFNSFKNILHDQGVEEYTPVIFKDLWNSSFCEVVDEVENNEYNQGTITKVVQNGYLLHKRLLIPAKVVVTKKTSAS